MSKKIICGRCKKPKGDDLEKNCSCGRKWFNGKKEKDVVAKLEEAFSIGCNVLEACLYSNITKDGYYRYIKKHKKLSDRFDALKDKPVLKARNTIFKDLENPDTAKWFLSRKRKDEFSTKIETENTHKLENIESIENTLKSIGQQDNIGTNKPIKGNSKDAV